MRILDTKDVHDRVIVQDAPLLDDYLSDDARKVRRSDTSLLELKGSR